MFAAKFLILAIVIVRLQFSSAKVHSHKVLDEEKAYYFAQVLVDNFNLTQQLWSIGEAFVDLTRNIRMSDSEDINAMVSAIDQISKNCIYNFILDSVPHLFQNSVFGNISKFVFDEFVTAYNASDFSLNISKCSSSDFETRTKDMANIFSHVNYVRFLQNVILVGKPIIDVLRENDSEIFVQMLSDLVGYVPMIWNDQSFQRSIEVITGELNLGVTKFLRTNLFTAQNIPEGNSTLLVKEVLRFIDSVTLVDEISDALKIGIDIINGKKYNKQKLGMFSLLKK